MAELVISSISNGGIKSNKLSENFSGLNQIKISPKTNTEKKILAINGFSINPVEVDGLECVSINNDLSVGMRDVFNFKNSTDVNRFEGWMSSVTSGIILMISHGENATTTTINNYFKKIGSIGWNNHWDPTTGTQNTRYAAIYDCGLKKIMVEQYGVSSAIKVSLEVVFDTFADIGVVGYGNSIVSDQKEYMNSKTTTPEINMYLNKVLLSELIVNQGETLRFSLDTYRDDLAAAAGESVRFYYIGYNGTTSVTSGYVSSLDTSGQWDSVYNDFVVPNGIDRIMVYATSWPIKSQYVGTTGVRSVSIFRKKPNVQKDGKATIGQWGFITEDAVETGGDIVGSIKEKNVTAFEYGNLEPVSFPQFLYNDGKYIKDPFLVVGRKFAYSISMVYTDTNVSANRIGSGSDDTIFIGMTTQSDPLGMGHTVTYAGKTIRSNGIVSCNKEYLYKLEVDSPNIKFYVNGVLIGTEVIEDLDKRTFQEIRVGSEMNGYIITSEYEDYLIPNNSRYYEYSQSEKLNFIKGSSPSSGIYYSGSDIVPDAGGGWLYCGVGSQLIPAGMKAGSKAWVTIVENNGAVLNTGIELNKRYEVIAERQSAVNLQPRHLFFFRLDGKNWITSGNMTNLKFDVDCYTDPDINSEKPVIEWVKNKKYTYNFNGGTCLEIPPLYSLNKNGYITLNFTLNLTDFNMYLFDGRSTNTQELQGGWIYLTKTRTLNISGQYFSIVQLDGKPYTGGVLAPYVPHSLVLELKVGSVIRTIGGRYNKTECWNGNIWDITMVGDNDARTYINNPESRLNYYSTGIEDQNGSKVLVYDTVDLSKWKMSDELNQPIQVLSNNRFKFIKDVSEGGMTFNLNLPPRGRFRIEYDIDCPRPLYLKDVYGTTVGVGSIMKSLPTGRYKGVLYQNHTESTHDSGLYVCVPNARNGDIVTIRSLVVYTTKTDAMGTDVATSNYFFQEFEEPQMIGNTMSSWVPNLANNNYLNILPAWMPQKESWRLRFLGDNFTVGYYLDNTDKTHGIFVTLLGTTLQFVVKNRGTTISNITVNHGFVAGKEFDVDIQYNFPNLSIKTNGVVNNSTYNHVDGISSNMCLRNNASVVRQVDMIESSNMVSSSRVYKLADNGYVIPSNNIIQNSLTFRKKLRSVLLKTGGGVVGWDSSIGDVAGNGRLKDDVYIYDNKISKIVSGGSSYSMIIEFEGKITPYTELEIQLNIDGIVQTKYAAIGSGNYVIAKDPDVDKWIEPSSQYKVIDIRPNGEVGLKFQNTLWKIV
ncbi:hinge long tail fiber proximal connector [Aeromonas phage ZPAH1]|nr:hinge long tail fiber proximal connector [Aeromonas phage ZPAH1]